MQAKVRTCLWFAAKAREAAEFYVSLLPNSKIERMATFEHMLGPEHGDVSVIEFTLGGTAYQAMEAGPHHEFNDAMSIVVMTDDKAETDRLWDALTADGGIAVQCGWLTDRFGMRWQIVPRRATELMVSGDEAAIRRLQQAMLPMQKLDIAALERAYASA